MEICPLRSKRSITSDFEVDHKFFNKLYVIRFENIQRLPDPKTAHLTTMINFTNIYMIFVL